MLELANIGANVAIVFLFIGYLIKRDKEVNTSLNKNTEVIAKLNTNLKLQRESLEHICKAK